MCVLILEENPVTVAWNGDFFGGNPKKAPRRKKTTATTKAPLEWIDYWAKGQSDPLYEGEIEPSQSSDEREKFAAKSRERKYVRRVIGIGKRKPTQDYRGVTMMCCEMHIVKYRTKRESKPRYKDVRK